MEDKYEIDNRNTDVKTPNDVSAMELRRLIRSELRKSGAIDALTAQFRYYVLDNLVASKENTSRSQAICLDDVLLRSIVINFLKNHDMVQTMAVFVPESNMQEKALSHDDIFRLMDTHPDGIASQMLKNKKNACVLLSLVSMATRSKSATTSTQTDKCNITMNARYDLNLELSRSHAKYDQALKQNRLNSTKNMDQVMRSFQLECDARYKQESERTLRRFKENLLHIMQQEELNKYQKKLQSMRENLKEEFESRLQKALNEARHTHHLEIKGIKNAMEANNKEKDETMKILEISKQEHTEEKKSLKAREIALDKEEKRINDLLQQANLKLKDIENKENDLKQKTALEYDMARKEAKLAYDDATKVLYSQRDCYIEEMKCFEAERNFTAKQQSNISSLQTELIKYGKQNFTLKSELEILQTRIFNLGTKFREFHSHIHPEETISSLDDFDLNTTLIKYKKTIENNSLLTEKLKNLDNNLQLKTNDFLKRKKYFEATLSSLTHKADEFKDEARKARAHLHEAVLKEERANAELTDTKILLKKSQDMLDTMKWDSQSLQAMENDEILLATDVRNNFRQISNDTLYKNAHVKISSEVLGKQENNSFNAVAINDLDRVYDQDITKSFFQISYADRLNVKQDTESSEIVKANDIQWPTPELKVEGDRSIPETKSAEKGRLAPDDSIEADESSVIAAQNSKKIEIKVNHTAATAKSGIQNSKRNTEAAKKVEDESSTLEKAKEEDLSIKTRVTIDESMLSKIEGKKNSMINNATISAHDGRLAAEVASKPEVETQVSSAIDDGEKDRVKMIDESEKERLATEVSKTSKNNHVLVVPADKKNEEGRTTIQDDLGIVEDKLESDESDASNKTVKNLANMKVDFKDSLHAASEKTKNTNFVLQSVEKVKKKIVATNELDEEELKFQIVEEREDERSALQAKSNHNEGKSSAEEVAQKRLVSEDSKKIQIERTAEVFSSAECMRTLLDAREKSKHETIASKLLSDTDEKKIEISSKVENREALESTEKTQINNEVVDTTPEKKLPPTENSNSSEIFLSVQNKDMQRSISTESAKINAAKIICRAVSKKINCQSALAVEGLKNSYEKGNEIFQTTEMEDENQENSLNSSSHSTEYSSDFLCSSDEIEVGSHGSYNDASWSNAWGF